MDVEGVKIDYLGHSGFLIECVNGAKIAIDPYNVSSKIEKVDLILITHSHYDHCSIKDIEALSREGTVIVVTPDSQSKITKVKGIQMEVVEMGEEFEFSGIKVEAFPAYNVKKDYHPKKEGWLGFIIKMKNVVIYHAGDTDKIPEMKKLTGYGKHGNYFIALLPVSGKYVMDVEEAVEVASLISPDLVIPMHIGSGVAGSIDDGKRFVEECKKVGLKAEMLEKI